MAGRPSTLTATLADAIAERLLQGAYIETAVVSSGVKKRTFYDWMKKGTEDENAGNAETPHAQFAWRIEVALAQVEIDLLKQLKEEKGQWTRFAWMLERRFRDRWALKKALEE